YGVVMAFVTIVTRVSRRPNLLYDNIVSVATQDDQDYDHLLLVDPVGKGMLYANQQFYRHAKRVRGKYVYMLDDDDIFIRSDVINLFKRATVKEPDVVVCKFDCG